MFDIVYLVQLYFIKKIIIFSGAELCLSFNLTTFIIYWAHGAC